MTTENYTESDIPTPELLHQSDKELDRVEQAITLPDSNSIEKGCVELLSVDLLEQNRLLVKELRRLADSLGLEFGWHYLLDLTWTIKRLRNYLNDGILKEKRIIDAGAGTGILQWYLAEQGAHVISVDRLSRAYLPMRFRKRYQVKGLRKQDMESTSRLIQSDMKGQRGPDSPIGAKARLSHLRDDMANIVIPKPAHKTLRNSSSERNSSSGTMTGSVTIYNQDLTHLEDISDSSIDAVVSISALEHNSPDGLEVVVHELLRVLKPGALLAATLTAAKYQDTWHKPSSGWLYTVKSLAKHFDLPEICILNEDDFDQLFEAIRNCTELRDNLAKFYFHSGENGMPWGIWDPQYLPVGVWKIKAGQ